MPPDSTTWRARTADVKVTLHDVGVVKSASQRNLAGMTIHSAETFSAHNDITVWKYAGLFLSVVAVKEYPCSVRTSLNPL